MDDWTAFLNAVSLVLAVFGIGLAGWSILMGLRTEQQLAVVQRTADTSLARVLALADLDRRDRVIGVLAAISLLQDWTWAQIQGRDETGFPGLQEAWRQLGHALNALPDGIILPECDEAYAVALTVINDHSWDRLSPLPERWMDPLMDGTQAAFAELREDLEEAAGPPTGARQSRASDTPE